MSFSKSTATPVETTTALPRSADSECMYRGHAKGTIVKRRKLADLLFLTIRVVAPLPTDTAATRKKSKSNKVPPPLPSADQFSFTCTSTISVMPVDGRMHIQAVIDKRVHSKEAQGLLMLGTQIEVIGSISKLSKQQTISEQSAEITPMPTIDVNQWTILGVSTTAGLKGVERIVSSCHTRLITIEAGARALKCDASEMNHLVSLHSAVCLATPSTTSNEHDHSIEVPDKSNNTKQQHQQEEQQTMSDIEPLINSALHDSDASGISAFFTTSDTGSIDAESNGYIGDNCNGSNNGSIGLIDADGNGSIDVNGNGSIAAWSNGSNGGNDHNGTISDVATKNSDKDEAERAYKAQVIRVTRQLLGLPAARHRAKKPKLKNRDKLIFDRLSTTLAPLIDVEYIGEDIFIPDTAMQHGSAVEFANFPGNLVQESACDDDHMLVVNDESTGQGHKGIGLNAVATSLHLATEQKRQQQPQQQQQQQQQHQHQNLPIARESRRVREAKRKAGEYETLDAEQHAITLAALKATASESANALPFDPLDSLKHDGLTDQRYVDYCMSRKTPQVLWMIERLRQLFVLSDETSDVTLRTHKKSVVEERHKQQHQQQVQMGDKQKEEKPQLVIVDVGCGRGDLTLNIAALIPSSVVVGVDMNAPSLVVGRERARKSGLTNVHFHEATVQDLLAHFDKKSRANDASAAQKSALDDALSAINNASRVVLIGLHACGGLTDAILALSLSLGAFVLCATCCFTKNADLRVDACSSDSHGHNQDVTSSVASSDTLEQMTTGNSDSHAHIRGVICPANSSIAEQTTTKTDVDACIQVVINETTKRDYEWWEVEPKEEGKRLANLCESHFTQEYHTAMALVNNMRLKWLASKRVVGSVSEEGDEQFVYRLLAFPESFSPKNQVLCVHPANR